MIQIAYISTATQPMTTEQLIALLQQSFNNNTASGVTGMMLYGNATFLQALEGEEKVVDALYDKISKDKRHSNIIFLHRKAIERRQYDDWTMAFKRVSDKELQGIEGLRDFTETNFNSEYLTQNTAVAENLMNHFSSWNPLLRELEEKEQHINSLKKSLAHARSCIEVAGLVLESIADAGSSNSLSERHLRLCEFAQETLRKS
jgi:DNA polymerase II small subunit/DNA polymerase delta subunit B